MAKTPGSKSAAARHAWRLLFDFLIRTAPARTAALGRHGLTPNDSRALHALHRGEGRSMRSLADEWECDASNATWIVDRLERLGLAERRPDPRDRRVKLVVLTERGASVRAELHDEFYAPPAVLQRLDRADLDALIQIMEKLHPMPGA